MTASVAARPSPALYAGFLLLTCSMLLVQQFLTRVFSIQFNSGLAFLAISTTFLGLGSAGVTVCAMPRLFDRTRSPRQLSWLGVVYVALLVLGFGVEVAVDRTLQTAGGGAESLTSQVQRVLVGSLCLLPAMFVIGLVIALVLRAHSERIGRLYAADLVGGGLGCLCVLPLMQWVGGDDGIFAIGALAATGSALLAHAHGAALARAVGAAFAVVLLALPFANRARALVDVQSHRTVMGGVDHWVKEDQELGRSWNALSRLGFFPTTTGREIYVRIDSSCQTSLPSQDPAHSKAYVAATDFERLPFVLDRHRRCLEIGAGGGRGIVLAKAMGAESVTGVEINPGIVEASLRGFPGFGVGNLVQQGQAQLLLGEGRSFVQGTDERFDSLTITFIQTGVASGSAAFALSEANLFTVEAFADFMARLTDDGVFYVYRHGGIECLRLISMLREVFTRLQLGDLRQHLYIARNAGNACLVLVGRSPLRPSEVERLDGACRELQLEVLYAPGVAETRPTNPLPALLADLRQQGRLAMGEVVHLFQRHAHAREVEPIEASYVRAGDPAAFAASCLVDIDAPTDDRPYFFFTGLRDLADFGLYFDPAGTGILGGTVVMLFWMGVAFTLLVLLLIVLPLWLRRRTAAVPARTGLCVLLYFSGLGMGYIGVQISFIQRFTLFLGHPVYAVAVVLLAFLLSSGLGSLCSERLFASGRYTLARGIALLAVILLLYNLLLPSLFHSSAIAWPVPAKIALSVALLFVLAFPMGTFFPHGIRLVERQAPDLVPWAWGANSAASVIGSILALILAIHAGFAAVAVTAAVLYAVTTLPAAAVLRRAASRMP